MSIGIQVGAVSFVDEGTEQVLDLFQERGAIDTIHLTTFTYGRGLAGRQIPGQPFPDHGKQESGEKTFHGGNYAAPHLAFYPGIDIGIPTGTKNRKGSPEDTYAAMAVAGPPAERLRQRASTLLPFAFCLSDAPR